MIATVASAVSLVACCALVLLSAAGLIFNGPPRPGTEVAIRARLDVLPWTPPPDQVPILSAPRICAGRPVAPNFWDWQ